MSSTPPPSLPCPQCHSLLPAPQPNFCPSCGASLTGTKERYRLIRSIGKGGMGEVFLAHDTHCERVIALKRIRSDLTEHPHVRRRFLKEARITSQLMHPGIIPIYSIREETDTAYYTMPFVEGETLKQIIRKARNQEKRSERRNLTLDSIPALMRIFMTICQAVAFAHTKGVLHRDLKPENIIVGKYGEVLILDWGLAKHMEPVGDGEEAAEFEQIDPGAALHEITRLGKVVGTVAYMAPERALGQKATVQTDIYALGAILYQLLTLKSPFQRGTLEEFRASVHTEELQDPIAAAPYRDIPKLLGYVATKCLSVSPHERYHSVDELIYDLENYLEGRSEWFHAAELSIARRDDWEFQENILIAKHAAIWHTTQEVEWVNLMISRHSFPGNIRLETSIQLKEKGQGVGVLFSVPEKEERKSITEGYCLWLGRETGEMTKLLRCGVEVMHAPDISLKSNQWTRIRIEKIDKTIHLYFDDVLQFSYIAHIPPMGTHVGLLSRDANFQMDALHVYVGNLNLTVSCLAIPDALLAHHHHSEALSEYHRIANSFSDRPEGREAIFRAGLTMIEQAKEDAKNKEKLLEEAHAEFEKLHGSPAGPLEYLGKALVYQTYGEIEEEVKCFEIAHRRFPGHPQLPLLQEHILSRMHEVAHEERLSTYLFALLAARHFSAHSIDTHTRRLFTSLQKHWEPLPFIEESHLDQGDSRQHHLAYILAFWLAQPYAIAEVVDEMAKEKLRDAREIANALCCLIELGHQELAQEKINKLSLFLPEGDASNLEKMISGSTEALEALVKEFTIPLSFSMKRTLLYLLDSALDSGHIDCAISAIKALKTSELDTEWHLHLDVRAIWGYLLKKEWKKGGEILYTYSLDQLQSESTPLYFLHGCYLAATEGEEIAHIHFSRHIDVKHPRSWTLASFAIDGLSLKQTFLWEEKQLYRGLSLYYSCVGDEKMREKFARLYQK